MLTHNYLQIHITMPMSPTSHKCPQMLGQYQTILQNWANYELIFLIKFNWISYRVLAELTPKKQGIIF
jgi:hypothetical protein